MNQGSVTIISWSRIWTTTTSPSPIGRPWLMSEQQGLNSTSWRCWLCRPRREDRPQRGERAVAQTSNQDASTLAYRTGQTRWKRGRKKQCLTGTPWRELVQVKTTRCSWLTLHKPRIPTVTETLFAEVEDWRWQWNTSSTSWKSGSVTGEAKCTQQNVEGRTRHRPPHCSGWEGLKLNLNSRSSGLLCWNGGTVK